MKHLSLALALSFFASAQSRPGGSGIADGGTGNLPRQEVSARARVVAPRAAGQAADAQNPLLPLGTVNTPSPAITVALNGQYAYACGLNEITVVNVQNPAAPSVAGTITSPLINNAGGIRCTVTRNTLSIFSDSISTAQGNRPGHVAFSLTNPVAPTLIGETAISKRFFQHPLYLGNYAFVPTSARTFFLGFLWEETLGDLLAVDLTNFAAPAIVGNLRNPVVSATFGGLSPVLGIAQAGPSLVYLGGGTQTGGNNDGTGRLQTIDISNPAGLRQVAEIQVPGTVHVGAPMVQGTLGLSLGNNGGYNPGFQSDPGAIGKIVFTTFDLSDRRAPDIIATRVTDYVPGSGGGAARIGANLFAFAGIRTPAGQEIILVVDTTNPRNLAFREYPITQAINHMVAVGKVLYTTTASGLRLYDIPDADAPVVSLCPSAVDLAFVVDRSSGVAGQAIADAVAGAKRMLTQLQPQDRAAVISFTSTGTLNQALTNDRNAAGAALEGVIPGGNTFIGAGIDAAREHLLGPARNPAAQPVMVILSDGRDLAAPNTTASTTAAATAKAAGIKIITIAYGQTTAAGNTRLAAMASVPGDSYTGNVSGDFGPVTVLDPSTCQAVITIQSNATAGPRTVQTRSGTLVTALPNAFTVQGNVVPQQTSVTIVGAPLPASAQSNTEVALSLTGLPSGTVSAANVRITLRMGGRSSQSVSSLASSIQAQSAGQATVRFRLPTTVRVAQPTAFELSLAGRTDTGTVFSSANSVVFTLLPTAALAAVTPTAARPGRSITVTLIGRDTRWVDGQTMASFGPGISVGDGAPGGFGRVDVIHAERAVAQLMILPSANAGGRDVEVRTGAELVQRTRGFQVFNARPAF